MDFIFGTVKRLGLHLIFIFLTTSLCVQGQDMQQLLDLTYKDSTIDQIRSKDASIYTAQDYFQLGMLEVANRNYKTALGHFEQSKSLGSKNVNAIELDYFMGRSEAGLRNFQKSAGYFEKLLQKGISPTILMMTPETYQDVYRQYKPLVVAYGLNFGFWDYVFLLVSIFGFVLSLFFIFFFSKKNRNVIFIGIFILAFSINILEYVFYWTSYIVYSPIRSLYLVLFFLYPPLLYLYIKKNIEVDSTDPILTKKEVLHFLVFFGSLLLLIIYRAFPERNLESSFQNIAQILFNSWFKIIYASMYLVSIFKIVRHRLQYLNKYLKRWLILLIVFYIFMIISYFLPSIFNSYGLLNEELEYFLSMIFTVFLFMCGVMAVIQPEVFLGNSLTESLKNKVKYKNSSLTDRMSRELKIKLGNLLENERIFMQSELNLVRLADELNIDRYSMSQVINEGFGKGFYELINEYRIEEAKRILQETDKNIGDVIFEVGFNNHASFYKAFKKHMKITPSVFIASSRKRLNSS